MVGNYLPPTQTCMPTCIRRFSSNGRVAIWQPWSLSVAQGGIEAASRSDLWPGITAESRRFIPYLPTMLRSVKTIQPSTVVDGGGGGVEPDQARYRSRNSPETKKLLFTATGSTCMCGCFTGIALCRLCFQYLSWFTFFCCKKWSKMIHVCLVARLMIWYG